VADHATRVLERTRGFRELPANILIVSAALVVQRQNDEITRLTEVGTSRTSK
jgi:magnesium transporter